MNSVVCTLFEGNYHYGVGALVNSLYRHGFRGVIWAGYRGKLPFWAKNSTDCGNYIEYAVADGCVIRFVLLGTQLRFTNYKPTFMLDLWKHYCPEADNLFYFDPDIVIKCRWSFFEEWVQRGIALCQDIIFAYMPANHPTRLAWKDYAEERGYPVINQISQFFNGGFIGLSRNHVSALRAWQDLLLGLESIGIKLADSMPGEIGDPFHGTDQDTLNIIPMVSSYPFSTVGPEGMDFTAGGFTMSHAVGSPKPWQKHMITAALHGSAPSAADKGYWHNSQHPIQLYSRQYRLWKQIDLRCGAAIGRFIRHSY